MVNTVFKIITSVGWLSVKESCWDKLFRLATRICSILGFEFHGGMNCFGSPHGLLNCRQVFIQKKAHSLCNVARQFVLPNNLLWMSSSHVRCAAPAISEAAKPVIAIPCGTAAICEVNFKGVQTSPKTKEHKGKKNGLHWQSTKYNTHQSPVSATFFIMFYMRCCWRPRPNFRGLCTAKTMMEYARWRVGLVGSLASWNTVRNNKDTKKEAFQNLSCSLPPFGPRYFAHYPKMTEYGQRTHHKLEWWAKNILPNSSLLQGTTAWFPGMKPAKSDTLHYPFAIMWSPRQLNYLPLAT